MSNAIDKDTARAMHDIGGVARYMCEPIDTAAHELTDFDREVDAIRGILGSKQIMSTDELRRGIESLPEADYLRLTYYQRWLCAMTGLLLQKGVITEAELQAALEDAA